LKESCHTRAKNKKKNLSDLMPIILKTVHKRWFSNRNLKYLKQFITRQKNSFEMNVIKVCLLIYFTIEYIISNQYYYMYFDLNVKIFTEKLNANSKY